MKRAGIPKASPIRPLRTMNVCAKRHGNPSSSCWDISGLQWRSQRGERHLLLTPTITGVYFSLSADMLNKSNRIKYQRRRKDYGELHNSTAITTTALVPNPNDPPRGWWGGGGEGLSALLMGDRFMKGPYWGSPSDTQRTCVCVMAT